MTQLVTYKTVRLSIGKSGHTKDTSRQSPSLLPKKHFASRVGYWFIE